MKPILKYYHTLKYLKPVQIYGRIYSSVKKMFYLRNGSLRNGVSRYSDETGVLRYTEFIDHDPWNTSQNILKGYFTFLNKQKHINYPPDWNIEADKLWSFNLHYLAWLHLLPPSEREIVVKDWITKNKPSNSIAWHPYVISLRLVNLFKEDFKDPEIIASLYQQSSYLCNNLEFYHPANHYLENAKALIFAGLYFVGRNSVSTDGNTSSPTSQNEVANNADLRNRVLRYTAKQQWFEKGCQILKNELPKQILNDGGYFELSIMYHAKILEGLLDILNILLKKNEFYKFIERYAERMLKFLISAAHPNGEIALLNDSTIEIVPTTDSILNYAERLGIKIPESKGMGSYPDSGYYIYRDENIYLIIDGGRVGPNNIPAHAHADIFNFELSVKGKKFIVDSGVYEYNAGEMRNYLRSTAAHNTLTIDSKDQAECWGSFRVARRYMPEEVSFLKEEDSIVFNGTFNGFSKLIGDNLCHTRKIIYEPVQEIINVYDKVTGNGDHTAESRIHLHPECELSINGNSIVVRNGLSQIEIITDENYRIEHGWYCPEFGLKQINKVITLKAAIPGTIEYQIKFRKQSSDSEAGNLAHQTDQSFAQSGGSQLGLFN